MPNTAGDAGIIIGDTYMIEGSCLCGTIRFAIEGDLPDLYQCHCSLCRKVTGAAANAALTVPADRFHWRDGETAIRAFVRDSGYRNDFCTRCGSTVPNPTRDATGYWIPAGLFDTPIGSQVGKHVFTASKADWDIIGGTARQFPGPPDSWT
jgi:hypothetical protein